MNVLQLASKALRMPPRVLAKKICARVIRWRTQRAERRKDLHRGTWDMAIPAGPLQWRLHTLPLPQRSPVELATIAEVCRRHLAHRYDLLGSGWIRWEHGVSCPGLLGHRFPPAPAVRIDSTGTWLAGQVPDAGLAECQALWRLVTPGYRPHDWQVDVRSGFRWSATIWHRDIRYGHVPGVDVKLPWELARMQHLPLLAQAYAHAKRGDPGDWEAPERYLHEVQDQILDFCAANPPRFGVNWACTMDVAIRVANWLLALDALQAAGAALAPAFLTVAATAVRAHGRFIVTHLEWDPVARGNHYLADLAGLAWAGAWLPPDAETDSWLTFAKRELVSETQRLFSADGSYGEASTAYHCLATETVVWGTLAIAGLSADRCTRLSTAIPCPHPSGSPPAPALAEVGFPAAHWQILARAGAAIRDFTTPDGGIALIGDDDSGRFFRWRPAYQMLSGTEAHARYLDLDPEIDPPSSPFPDLDHRNKHAVAGATLAWNQDPLLTTWASVIGSDESALARAIAGSALPSPAIHPPAGGPAPCAPDTLKEANHRWTASPNESRVEQRFPIPAGPPLTEGLEFRAFPDLGLWIWRSPRLYLAVRCGSGCAPGLSGHAHVDQLALELHLDNLPLLRDPGSFLYTPSPEERRRYRGAAAHLAPIPAGVGWANAPSAPFAAVIAHGQCCHASAHTFIGRVGTHPHVIFRSLDITAGVITVRDVHTSPPVHPATRVLLPFAVAYGRRLRPHATS